MDRLELFGDSADAAKSARDFVPAHASLDSLREAARTCRGCDLYRDATQTVFGEGPERARLVLVGEQPGDSEDLRGRPFVGPAGALLRRSLAEAGISESDVYITNAVKHFKFVERGKRRIHATPKVTEVRACTPWLQAELEAIGPEIVVALGATAARVLLGNDFRVTQHRKELHSSAFAPRVAATVHPSSILRAADDAARARETEAFVADLRWICGLLDDAS